MNPTNNGYVYIYNNNLTVDRNQTINSNGAPLIWDDIHEQYKDINGNISLDISKYTVNDIITDKKNRKFTNEQKSLYSYTKLYKGIKNNGFIKDIFKDLINMPFKKHLFIKASDELVNQSFSLPNPTYFIYYCKCQKILDVLNNLIPLNIQEMLCAGDLKTAIKTCDIEKTNDNNLISIICKKIYTDIENKKIDLESIKLKNYQNNTQKLIDIENCKNEIDDLLRKIENIKIRIQEANMDPITLCDIEHPTIIKCCNQKFNFQSIMSYITTTNTPKCPLCKTLITKDSLIIIDNDITDEEIEKYGESFDKIDNLKHIMKNKISSNAKVIIFSQYDNTFDLIIKILNELKIEYKFLKGHSTTITNNLEWHKKDNNQQKVLFLNAKFMGAGINIHWTTDVILYHSMNKELEAQMIGRAHRFPRTSSVNVHKLLYKNHE